MKSKGMVAFAWGLSLIVSVVAIIAWVGGYQLEFQRLNLYLFFPVLGLLAFSLMWAHYIVGASRRLAGLEKLSFKTYFKVTGLLALTFILLHPSLLIFQLWRDGGGLPPLSYIHYVGPVMEWAVLLGSFSFLIFLSFETKRWFEDRGWWPIIDYAQVVAMFAIIAHSLALGSNLQKGWFRGVWWVYAVSLVLSVAYTYYYEIKQTKDETQRVKKVIGIVVVILLVSGIGVFAYSKLNSKDQAKPANNASTSKQPELDETIGESTFYTLDEVKPHNKEDDCWTIINGGVYNLTPFIPRHPGGSEILKACGEDGTTLFTTRHDESGNAIGSGTPHSSSAESQLQSLKIGTIKQ